MSESRERSMSGSGERSISGCVVRRSLAVKERGTDDDIWKKIKRTASISNNILTDRQKKRKRKKNIQLPYLPYIQSYSISFHTHYIVCTEARTGRRVVTSLYSGSRLVLGHAPEVTVEVIIHSVDALLPGQLADRHRGHSSCQQRDQVR